MTTVLLGWVLLSLLVAWFVSRALRPGRRSSVHPRKGHSSR